MREEKISIILPVYNVANYIKSCTESILNQTYSNFEVIVVNDGTEDNSISILLETINNDSRFIIYNKKNGGLSDARNFGLSKSTGKYITFIDSDDYIDIDYLDYLYKLLKKYNVSMSMCSLYNVFSKKNSVKIHDLGTGEEGVMSSEIAIENMCYQKNVDTCAYAKLYKRELFESICYPKGMLFEDIGTTYKLFLNSDKIAYGYNSKYYYNIRNNSIVTSEFNIKKLDLLEMTDRMGEDVLLVYPRLVKAVNRRKLYARFSTINQMSGYEYLYPDCFLQIKKYILTHSYEVFKDKNVPVRDKVAILLFKYFNYRVYKKIWTLYSRLK